MLFPKLKPTPNLLLELQTPAVPVPSRPQHDSSDGNKVIHSPSSAAFPIKCSLNSLSPVLLLERGLVLSSRLPKNPFPLIFYCLKHFPRFP